MVYQEPNRYLKPSNPIPKKPSDFLLTEMKIPDLEFHPRRRGIGTLLELYDGIAPLHHELDEVGSDDAVVHKKLGELESTIKVAVQFFYEKPHEMVKLTPIGSKSNIKFKKNHHPVDAVNVHCIDLVSKTYRRETLLKDDAFAACSQLDREALVEENPKVVVG